MTKHLRPEELAAQIQKHPKTLANWRGDGRGPAYVKVGGSILYPQDEVDRWLESRTVRPKNERDSAG